MIVKHSRVLLGQNGLNWGGGLCFWGIILSFLFVPLTSIAVPIVTVIDDDARSEQAIESVKQVADLCGIKVTFAAIANHLAKNPKVAEKLHHYVEEGHEIASHSLTHSPKIWQAGDAISIQAIEQEIVNAENVFEGLDLHPKSFVYPYGNFPKTVRHGIFDVVSRYYPVAFNARGDINLPGNMYPLYVSRHPLRSHNSMFMTKRLIDEAIAAGDAWVVILTHSAKSDFSADMLLKTIRYAQDSGAVFLPASVAWQQVSSWPMMNENHLPNYTRIGDYLNAAYFHLPILLGGFTLVVLSIICLICFYLRYRKKKASKLEKTL